MKIAMTDLDIIWENKAANQKQCCHLIEEAAEYGADCILFPEMTLTGFSMAVEKIQDKNQESVSFFTGLAAKYKTAVGFGYVTVSGGKGRNHFCFIDERGNVLADYEKIHPFTYAGEDKVYEGGNRICSFEWHGFTCGMFICYDLRFPEVFQQLPVETDVIFLIANWPESRLEHWYTLLRARAVEMQCYIVGINRTGEGNGLHYAKSSIAFSPDGKQLGEIQEHDRKAGEGKEKENRYVELDQDRRMEYIKNFPTRADRRPDIYNTGYVCVTDTRIKK